MVLVYNMNMDFALRIIIKICAMPYRLATKDLKIRCEGEDAMMQNVNQSHMTILSCIVYRWWSKEAKYFRSPASSCSAFASSDSSNPMQVWIFMDLATGVPDSSECNQTSHEKTGMCLINQPAPEAKACNHVPRREKKERSILSMYFLSLCNVV